MNKDGRIVKNKESPPQSDVSKSVHKLPLNNQMSSVKKNAILKKCCHSNVAVGQRAVAENNITNYVQPSTITANQGESIPVNATSNQSQTNSERSKSQGEVRKELLALCNKQTLFDELVKEIEAERILREYQAKRSTWDKKEIQVEAARVLGINLNNKSLTEMAKNISSVQKVLQELPNLVNSRDEFAELEMKTYGHLLNDKIFELVKPEEMKKIIREKFSAEKLFDMFRQNNNSQIICQILEMASVDTIAHAIKTKNNPETSQILLETFSEMPDNMNSSCSSSNMDVAGHSSTIIDFINSNKYLKTSELILNFMLQNVQEIHSNEIKQNIVDILINKFDTSQLVDILHKAVKTRLNQNICLLDTNEL